MVDHSTTLNEVFTALGTTNKEGLSSSEASQRLLSHGYNELQKQQESSILRILVNQLNNPLVWILIVATVISSWIDYQQYLTEGGSLIAHLADAIVILVIVVLNTLIGFIQEYKAERAIDALKQMMGEKATIRRDGVKQTISSKYIVPGDILLLREGDKVSADCRVIVAHQLKTQEAALTGESQPIAKDDAVVPSEAPLGDRTNMVFSGTTVVSGRAETVVVSTGMRTQFGKIAQSIQQATKELTPLQKKLKKLAGLIGGAVLVIAIIVFITGISRHYLAGTLNLDSLRTMFMVAVALAVAAIPEGLPAVVTIALGVGVQRMAKRHVIVRKLPSVETLGSVTVICTDKTGTLTHNEMTVKKIWAGGTTYDVTGSGYSDQGEVCLQGEPVDLSALHKIFCIGSLCNDSEFDKDKTLMGDPTEGCLLVSAIKGGVSPKNLVKDHPRLGEIPFCSERKLMTTVHKMDGHRVSLTKGAVDILLTRCDRILIDGKIEPLDAVWKDKIQKANDEFANDALRVLGFAYKEGVEECTDEDLETNMIFSGMQAMVDPPREGVISAIQRCKEAGIKIIMITGDHITTAKAIARELNIEGKAITGSDLQKIDLENEVEEITIYARVNPSDKLKIVRALQKRRQVVAMTGDGVNDAPALKQADIGVSMGITGTDVSKEASDMILTDDNFTSIVNAVEEGRGIYGNIRKFFAFLISGNIGEVLVIFLAILMGLPLPLTAILILVINLVTDGLPATALSVDPFEPGAMKQPPRSPNQPIYSGLTAFVVVYPIILTVVTLGLFSTFYFVTEDQVKSQTIAFFALAMFELFQAYAVRSLERPSFKVGIFKNKYLVAATISSLITCLLVIYIPSLQEIFGTTALSPMELCLTVFLASIGFIYLEVSKGLRPEGA